MVEWYTPPHIIEAARQTMGGIDLDPASCEEANLTVQAEFYFDRRQDGLLWPWKGRLWLNPPFGAVDTRKFVAKAIREFDEERGGEVDQACILVLLTPDSQVIQWLCERAHVCFPRDKVAFIQPGGKRATVQFPVGIFYLGGQPERFAIEFGAIGATMAPFTAYRPQPELRFGEEALEE